MANAMIFRLAGGALLIVPATIPYRIVSGRKPQGIHFDEFVNNERVHAVHVTKAVEDVCIEVSKLVEDSKVMIERSRKQGEERGRVRERMKLRDR